MTDSSTSLSYDFLHHIEGFFSFFLLISFIFLLAALLIIYFIDKNQTAHSVRRNYPVIGRLRYLFEYMGHFFRQYFFTMDREELPFNRADRSWVYRAAKNIDNTIAFGSTRSLSHASSFIFLNCPFPSINTDVSTMDAMLIGPFCKTPYHAHSFFNISGMSYGAISKPAVLALSQGAKKSNCWLNTGEGAISPYHLQSGCDIVYQIGTAKYGLRDTNGNFSEQKLKVLASLPQIRMFEIKLSQGAKPGKGGILPGNKVSAEIANIRGIPIGQDSISPNSHPDITSVSELLDYVELIRSLTGKPVGFKIVLGEHLWLNQLCLAIINRGIEAAPDFITLDSADGGTGAAPQSLIDYMGLPLKQSLPLLSDKLSYYGLKDRIKIIASGKMITPADAAWALCMGASFVVSARGFMFALGCIQALQCNKNTCPTGIATHNKKLQNGLDPINKAQRVANYATNLVREVGVIAHSCGVDEPRKLGREHLHIIDSNGIPKSALDLHPYHSTDSVHVSELKII
tara:strand:- start:2777 stop:4318 length:1542 start_codon:yes stop_codon:yes gene_type:complete